MMEREPKPHALKSRLLADLVRAVAAGHVVQATTVAALTGRNAYDLVQQSVRTAGARQRSVDERLQSHLREIVTVLSLAERQLGDVLQAIHWYLEDRGAEGAQPTPEALIAAGRLDEAWRRLHGMRSSFRRS